MAELADAPDLGSGTARCVSSSLSSPIKTNHLIIKSDILDKKLKSVYKLKALLEQTCGSSSVVESLLAKQVVASSNLVSRFLKTKSLVKFSISRNKNKN